MRRRSRRSSRCDLLSDSDVAALLQFTSLRELSRKDVDQLHATQTSRAHVSEATLDVTSLSSVDDVYRVFGLHCGDRTHRRDQVKMWELVRNAMTAEIETLTKSGVAENYDKAKRLHEALEKIRAGFHGLQTKAVLQSQADEQANFDKATSKLRAELAERETRRVQAQEAFEKNQKHDLKHQQDIERENVAHERAIARPSKRRHTKRVLELLRAEHGLASLARFDEAKNVRRMIDKLEIPAQRRHKLFEDARRARSETQLNDAQDYQRKRLNERLGEVRWTELRRAQRHAARQKQRIHNLHHDMSLAHARDRQRNPELAPTPSALLQKRQHNHDTSAERIGTRLLDVVLGKQDKQAVYVAPLCAQHDFERPLSGTVIY